MSWTLFAVIVFAALVLDAVLIIILGLRIAALQAKVDLVTSALRVRNDALMAALHDRRHARAVVEDVPGYKHKVSRINWPSSDRPPEA